jgi:hypothetical protein
MSRGHYRRMRASLIIAIAGYRARRWAQFFVSRKLAMAKARISVYGYFARTIVELRMLYNYEYERRHQ